MAATAATVAVGVARTDVVAAGVAGATVPDVAGRSYGDGAAGVEDGGTGAVETTGAIGEGAAVVGGTAGTKVHPVAMDGADDCVVALATAGCVVAPDSPVAPAAGEVVTVDQAGAAVEAGAGSSAGDASDGAGVTAVSIATEEGRPAPAVADFAARSVSSGPAVIAAAAATSAAGSMAGASPVATGDGAAMASVPGGCDVVPDACGGVVVSVEVVVAPDAKASGATMDSARDASAIDGAMTFAVDAGVTALASAAADVGSGAVRAASDDTSPSGGTADADASAACMAATFVATSGASLDMPAGVNVSAQGASAMRATAAVSTKTAGVASIADCVAVANSAG
ncbi:hypothetical protein [Burkholderia ubonensis]|uniref:hypothetical protein n=1 Tax=Burkholderia ubonensis TaxID=101571 RepID=UPI0018E124FE